jgi:hypothetical protein
VHAVQTIKIQQIDCVNKLPINKKSLGFAILMTNGIIFPPINVERMPAGRYVLRGGRHRLAAHKLLGKTEIRASVAKQE